MSTVYSNLQLALQNAPALPSNQSKISNFHNFSQQQRLELARQLSCFPRCIPTHFGTVEISVRQSFFSIRVYVKFDSDCYKLVETMYSCTTGMRHIDVYKNKILLKSELITASNPDTLKEKVKSLLDRFVNRPGTKINTFSYVYDTCNEYFPCFPLFELLKPEHFKVAKFSFATNFGTVDLSLVDFINTSKPRETHLMIDNPHLTGRLLNLSRQNYQIYEERILEILFLAHCHKFILEDFPVGSSYHASEKFRHLVPNCFLHTIMSTFPNSERVRPSKLCTTPFVASAIPIRMTVAFGKNKSLEIYNDDCNYVVVVATAGPPRRKWSEILNQALRTKCAVVFIMATLFLSFFSLSYLMFILTK